MIVLSAPDAVTAGGFTALYPTWSLIHGSRRTIGGHKTSSDWFFKKRKQKNVQDTQTKPSPAQREKTV
jgi:hypothetical protein